MNTFSCLRMWTPVRSVARTMCGAGPGAPACARCAGSSVGLPAKRSSSCAVVISVEQPPISSRVVLLVMSQPLGLVRCDQLVEQPLQVAVEHIGQVMQVDVHTVVGHAVLREVVRPYLFRPIA